ncbi:hypothetical protein [Dokdonia sp.]|uniref:hypothetical protein n=1 Tax=Dokdonia sp. TaxID=2024995 RepID=UPI003266B3B7
MNRALIGLLCVLLFSCKTEETRTDVYSVLRDVTDPLLADVNADEITGAMHLENMDRNVVLRYSEISDVDMHIVEQVVFKKPVTGLLGNEVENTKTVRTFKKDIAEVLTPKDTLVLVSHSAIFVPILQEIQYLNSLPDAGDKILVVYSNLMENDPSWLSFYRSEDVLALYHTPESIVQRYLSKADMTDKLIDVSVHIIYMPSDIKDNRRFNALRSCYMMVFSELGISLSFSGNITQALVVL